MKELINIAVLIVMAAGSTTVIRRIQNAVRKAALEKAAQGLRSLTKMTNALRTPRPKK